MSGITACHVVFLYLSYTHIVLPVYSRAVVRHLRLSLLILQLGGIGRKMKTGLTSGKSHNTMVSLSEGGNIHESYIYKWFTQSILSKTTK